MGELSTIDLSYENQLIKKEFFQEFSKLYDSNQLIASPIIAKLQSNIAQYCGTKYCTMTGSGTMALHVACNALELKPGDEVVIPANTFVGTAIAVHHTGAKVLLADVDPDTLNLSAESVERVITPKTKAICLVHLYGNLVDPQEFARFGLPLIEDASHAFGGRLNGKHSGNLGEIAGFSAGAIKGFGALGHAGFITYNRDDYQSYIEAFVSNGQVRRHYARHMGHNFRIDSANALFLSEKLANYAHLIDRRKKVMDVYNEYFDQQGVKRQRYVAGSDPVLWVYVIRVNASIRGKVMNYLKEKANINTLVQYKYTINQMPIRKMIAAKPTQSPVATRLTSEIVSLPVHPGINPEDAEYICRQVIKAIKEFSH